MTVLKNRPRRGNVAQMKLKNMTLHNNANATFT